MERSTPAGTLPEGAARGTLGASRTSIPKEAVPWTVYMSVPATAANAAIGVTPTGGSGWIAGGTSGAGSSIRS